MKDELIKHIILNISIENPEDSQVIFEAPDFDEDDIDSIESEVSRYWVARHINSNKAETQIIKVIWDFENGFHLVFVSGSVTTTPIQYFDLIAPIDLDDYIDDLECDVECEDCDCGD